MVGLTAEDTEDEQDEELKQSETCTSSQWDRLCLRKKKKSDILKDKEIGRLAAVSISHNNSSNVIIGSD